MSNALMFLGGIGDTGEKYSLVTAPIKEESISVGDQHVAIFRSNSPVITQDLGKIFQVLNQSLISNQNLETTTPECLVAWRCAKSKFEKADQKFNSKYNFIQRILIKLWHWLIGKPTLDKSFKNLSESIIKSSPWWKHFNERKDDAAKLEYLKAGIFEDGQLDPIPYKEFYAKMISMMAEKEHPKLIFEGIYAYLDKLHDGKTYNFLIESGSLHQTLNHSEGMSTLLDLTLSSLKKMNKKDCDQFLSDMWIASTLFVYAIDNHDLKLVEYLIKKVKNKNSDFFNSDTLGRLLYRSVNVDDYELTRLFLKENTDLHIHDHFGDTPLHLATQNENLRITKLLLDQGAKKDLQNEEGKTPKEYASTHELIALYK